MIEIFLNFSWIAGLSQGQHQENSGFLRSEGTVEYDIFPKFLILDIGWRSRPGGEHDNDSFFDSLLQSVSDSRFQNASPTNAFLLNLGLESLHLRVKRHCENAEKIAEYLSHNDKISSINYPSVKGNKYYDLCKKYLKNGSSGVISFCVKGGREASIKFLDNLKLARIVTHVADARTCVLHPAGTTHRQLTDEQLIACGITPDLVRLSVGIENADDIIEDIESALNA